MTLSIGSLFSGIGGLELGLEACGLGPVVYQAELDPFCRAVLAKHWPGVRRYTDVREIDATTERPDVICGGFPCQDLSLAGKQGGLSADRSGLWWEFRRIVRVLRPRFVVVENVHGAWRSWLPVVRRGLWKVGYASVPIRVRASDVGAPHERARVFVVAHAEGQRHDARRQGEGHGAASHGQGHGCQRADPDAERQRRDGLHERVEPGPLAPDAIDRGEAGHDPDANREGQLQPRRVLPDQWGRSRDGNGWDVEPVLRRGDHGVRDGLDGCSCSYHQGRVSQARTTCDPDADGVPAVRCRWAPGTAPRGPSEAAGGGNHVQDVPRGSRPGGWDGAQISAGEDLRGVRNDIHRVHALTGEDVQSGMSERDRKAERREAMARRSHRAAREKALGNAVVPQAAQEAWMTAMEMTGWGKQKP